jgi:hypothetical protein
VLVAVLVLATGLAEAGRKRVVVLDFDGPKAEKFHADLVKLLKKSHTVIATDKWNGAAEELDAGAVTDKNIKKVARKLKVDGVIEGKIEKRRDEYIVRLKLRAGTSGEVGNQVETKATSAKLAGKAQRDVKDELVAAIDELEENHGGAADDGDDAGEVKSTKKKHGDDDADSADVKSTKKKHGGDDDSADGGDEPKHGAFSKHSEKGSDKVGDDDSADTKSSKKKHGDDDADADSKAKKKHKDSDDEVADARPASAKKKGGDDEVSDALATKHDDDDSPKSKKHKGDDDSSSGGGDDDSPRKARKKVARSDDDSTSAEAGADVSGVSDDTLSPSERAIDAVVGLSFIARRLSFTYSPTLAGSQIPPAYKQSIPVAGAFVDAVVYPLDISHTSTSPLRGLGLELVVDRVLRINSEKADNMGVQHTLATVSERYGFGAVYRYPIGKLAVGARLLYEAQSFLVQQSLPDGEKTDIPDVNYNIFELGGFGRYPLNPKLALDADLGVLLVTSTGSTATSIGSAMEYGKASTFGYEISGGADYMLTRNIFLRGQFRLESISMTFAGGPGTLANNRDTDPTTKDVSAAKDLYFGGMVTAGYAY